MAISDEKQSEPRPYWRRSVLWDFEDAIRKRIAENESYPQILSALKRMGLREKLSVRRLAQFCVSQLGIHSLRPSRHDRTRGAADKKSAAPATPSAPSPALKAPSAKTSASAISDALGPEPSDEWAEFRKP